MQWLAVSGNLKTTSLLLSSVEELSDKLSKEFQQFKEDIFYSPLQIHANDSVGSRGRMWKVTHHGMPYGFS